jgi:hypothetical protein
LILASAERPRDRYRLRRAGCIDSLAGQPVGGRESPRAAGHHANPNAQRFAFRERANFTIFGGKVALADVHHASIGVRGATLLRGVDCPVCPVLHVV